MNLFTFVTYIRRILKLIEKLPEVLISNVSNGKHCIFFLFDLFVLRSIEVVRPLPDLPI